MAAGDERLKFGTAGLRAALGDGPLRMNVQTVELAATAIARWLPPETTVVIGRDARYGSEDFANVTARVLAEFGHRPQLFPDVVPTPVVAHAVSVRPGARGVMVTASHNPATDNGYKVYAAGGSQILPDAAADIETTMSDLPWPTEVSTTVPESVELLGSVDIDSYLAAVSRPAASEPLTIIYSAMHGVGGELFVRALEQAGHRVHSVPEQHQPDPDFPTAPFPNPEEPGTLDLAVALAEEEDADLVLANDPDADRLAVAVRREGGWERLTGDQIGAALGWYLIDQTSSGRAVATTIVSSSLLGKIAASAGVSYRETLTGFKWLVQDVGDGLPLVFAYEEALGYSVMPSIPDKDGISAGLVFAELTSALAGSGRSVDDLLADLYDTHGFHATSQVSVRYEGDDSMVRMTERMASLRANPPTKLGGGQVSEVVDVLAGTTELPPSDVLIFRGRGSRLIIRPSGTEPKIKAYIEAVAEGHEQANALRTALEHDARQLLN